MDKYLIGVDWGGTRIKSGVVGMDGALRKTEIGDTRVTAEIEPTFDTLAAELEAMIAAAGARCAGLGIGLSGVVDPERGVVYLPGKIKGLEGFPIVPRLRERLRVPVWAENDGAIALYAEKHLGHARDKAWAVVLTLGTGIGSGVMLEGRIPKDPRFMFGVQIGHFVINAAHDQLCLTGNRGTGEILASATGLALAVRSGLQRGIPSTLSDDYWRDPHSIDFKAVIERGVALDDRLCLDELRRWTRALGWVVVNAIHAYSPEVVILTGGATAASGYFLGELQKQVDAHIFRYPPGQPVPILVSELGDHAGVCGAAMMVRERLEGAQA